VFRSAHRADRGQSTLAATKPVASADPGGQVAPGGACGWSLRSRSACRGLAGQVIPGPPQSPTTDFPCRMPYTFGGRPIDHRKDPHSALRLSPNHETFNAFLRCRHHRLFVIAQATPSCRCFYPSPLQHGVIRSSALLLGNRTARLPQWTAVCGLHRCEPSTAEDGEPCSQDRAHKDVAVSPPSLTSITGCPPNIGVSHVCFVQARPMHPNERSGSPRGSAWLLSSPPYSQSRAFYGNGPLPTKTSLQDQGRLPGFVRPRRRESHASGVDPVSPGPGWPMKSASGLAVPGVKHGGL